MWGGVRFDLALNEKGTSKQEHKPVNNEYIPDPRKYSSSPALMGRRADFQNPFVSRYERLMPFPKREKFYKSQFHSHTDSNTVKKYKQWYVAEVLARRNQRKQVAVRAKYNDSCCNTGYSPARVPANPGTFRTIFLDGEAIRLANERRGSVKSSEGFKVVLLGDSGSGKSSTLIRLHENKFIEAYHATIGASFIQETLIVEDKPVKLAIWDTAGSERYFALLPMYYRGSDAAIVVFSIVNDDSYEQAKVFVKEIIDRVSPRPVIALVGNKLDLEQYRQVTTREAQLYALDNDLIYSEISAKTGDNVLELFMEVAKMLLRGLSKSK